MRIALTILLVLSVPGSHASDGVTLGYLTGNDYMALSKGERASWAMGVADGIMAEAAMANPLPDGSWLGKCLSGIPSSQLQAMIDSYISQFPEGWRAPAALIARGKLQEFCKRRG